MLLLKHIKNTPYNHIKNTIYNYIKYRYLIINNLYKNLHKASTEIQIHWKEWKLARDIEADPGWNITKISRTGPHGKKSPKSWKALNGKNGLIHKKRIWRAWKRGQYSQGVWGLHKYLIINNTTTGVLFFKHRTFLQNKFAYSCISNRARLSILILNLSKPAWL